MIRKSILAAAILLSAFAGFSQTLFTYGNYSVSAQEFLRAFNKNNTQPSAPKAKAMQDYLDLYINSRLKIREAYDRGYDTLLQIQTEVNNLRNQIIENYMSDPETMNRLTKEAFERSQKDIHAGHIYIPIVNGDTVTAFKLANNIHARLLTEDFSALAVQYSQDPSVKTNKGDIGWITVFTLPYTFENAIYSLAPGASSAPVRSKAGYHIFKNIGERKAVGKMKAKQILLAFPPGADAAAKAQLAKRADSLYKRIIAGDDFGKLAMAFSNDYVTSVTGGTMPDFGVGQYEPAFEAKVWTLAKDGAVTKPFQTSHGYHIVKRTSIVPVISDPNNKLVDQDLRQRIITDQRWKISRDIIYQRVIKQAGFTQAKYDEQSLWSLTDSLLDRKPLRPGVTTLTEQSPLFKLGDTTIKVADWSMHAQAFRYRPDGTGLRSYDELMKEFVNNTVFQYYRDHLEQFNEEFRYQMSEFRDGNLFFEIMQQEIWNKAHSDTTELLALYNANKNKYNWLPSADAVIFFCADAGIAKTLHDQLKKTPAKWKTLSDALAEKVVADSSRYEWGQIPNLNKMLPTPGMITTPLINKSDNTASFAYIIKIYPTASPRSYAEAKGLVINDYQALLEEQWIRKLKEKYPVKVNQQVFADISK